MSDPLDSPPSSPRRARVSLSFVPDHRDLYVLAAGLLLGVLLCPAVLGRVSPRTYASWFGDEKAAIIRLTTYDIGTEQVRQRIAAADATSVALSEFSDARQAQREPYVQAVRDGRHNSGRLIAAWLGVIIMMIFETLPDARATVWRGRLSTARYALMALALALMLAQPQIFRGLSPLFLALIVIAAVVVAMVPLSRRSAAVVGGSQGG